MLKCWSEQPEKRPPFTELVKIFTALLEEVAEYMDFSFVSGDELKTQAMINYKDMITSRKLQMVIKVTQKMVNLSQEMIHWKMSLVRKWTNRCRHA